MTADRDFSGSDAEVRRAAAAFAQPSRSKGALQLLTSFGPFVAACVAMYLAYPISPWLTLALAVPTGALLLRVFIVQHDCGHGSFLPSRRANVIVGRICSLITMTPFANWCRQHGLHHADWNNLDRTDGGVDIYSACLTVRQYLALSRWQRFRYRVARHPLIANVAFPPLLFLLVYRVPFDTPPSWVRERRSVHLTNLSLVALFGTLTIVFGWRQVLLIHVPVIAVSSILGVWLFSLQHRFETSVWTPKAEWNYVDAALRGASWFRLPKVLHWLTGNIGYHHVHHLNPRVPNYRLARAHEALQAMRPVKPLGFFHALSSPGLTLWDEASGRLVRFRDARKATQ
jgi:omega-6 fatty acid desaturase (delta-12 desaturase)